MTKNQRPTLRTLAGLTALLALWAPGCADPPPPALSDGFVQTEGPEPARVEEGGRALEVTSPLPGALIKTPIVQLQGRAEGMTEVRVDGQLVAVERGAFAASVQPGEGPHTILVQGAGEGEGLSVELPVVVDLKAPVLTVTEPARGRFAVAGRDDRIAVRGHVSDAGAGVERVEINGHAVSVAADGSFRVTVTPAEGVNTVSVAAVDRADRRSEALRGVLYGDFAPYERPTSDGITGRVDRSAFPVVEEAMLDMLEGGLIDDLLAANMPQSDQIRITGVDWGRADIELTPMDGFLRARVRIYDLTIGVRVTQSVVVTTITLNGSVSADPAEIIADIAVAPTPSGSVSARVRGVEIALHGFDISVDGILDWLAWAVEDLVRGYAESTLVDLIGDVVLAELFDPSLLHRELVLLGRTLPFDLKLTRLSVDRGGMSFAADADMPLAPASGTPSSPGVLVRDTGSPQADPERMVRLELAADFLNKILAKAWRGGLLNLNVKDLIGDGGALPVDLNAGSMALLVGRELRDHAQADTPVSIKLRPLLPPVATVQPGAGRELKVEIADMMMDFALEPPGGPAIPWASVAVTLTLDVGVTLVNGSFSFSFDVKARADLDNEPLFDIEDVNLEGVVVGLLEGLPGILGDAGLDGLFDLGQIEILGVQMTNAAIDSEGDYLTFEVDLRAP